MFDPTKVTAIRDNALALTIACDELVLNPPPDADTEARLVAVAKLAGELCTDARAARSAHRASGTRSPI